MSARPGTALLDLDGLAPAEAPMPALAAGASGRLTGLRRLLATARLEAAHQLLRPMTGVVIAILALLSWALSTGRVKVAAGAAMIGGREAWITSEFQIASLVAVVGAFLFPWFVAAAAGGAVERDREAGIAELLDATPLTRRQRAWGKLLGVLAAYGVLLAAQVGLAIAAFHLLPGAADAGIRGPFQPLSYLRPALLLGLPSLVFFAGLSFYLGTRFRSRSLAGLLPVAYIATLGFLWNWTPAWLSAGVDRLLMLIDPSGYRWVAQTYVAVDRGVEFYNHAALTYDPGFVASRLVLLAVGLLAAEAARRSLGLEQAGAGRRVRRAAGRKGRTAVTAKTAATTAAASVLIAPPLPAAASRVPSALATAREVVRLGAGRILRSPGLYLLALFLLVQTLSNQLVATGAFDTPLLLTPGAMAAGSLGTLALLGCLVLTVFLTEGLARDDDSNTAEIVAAAPAYGGARLLGKAGAAWLALAVCLAITLVAQLIALAIQGRVAFDLTPYLLTWGLLLPPTYLLWTGWLLTLWSLTGSRGWLLGAGAAPIGWTIYNFIKGDLTWLDNWLLFGRPVPWSDLAMLELDRGALLLNRSLVAAGGVLLISLALALHRRRVADRARRPPLAKRLAAALAPRNLMTQLRAAVGGGGRIAGGIAGAPSSARARLGVLATVSAVVTGALWLTLSWGIAAGPGGDAAEEEIRDFRRRNLLTWAEAPQPATRAVELEIDLQPAAGSLRSRGRLSLVNHTDEPMARFALTPGPGWRETAWTLDGEPATPEDSAGLAVFELAEALPPGGEIALGFSFANRVPDGMRRKADGQGQFILPSGVVLNSFGNAFMPMIGYAAPPPDPDDALTPRQRPPGYHEEVLPPFAGSPLPTDITMTVHAPADFIVNGVGTKVRDEVAGGRRTVTWESGHPVRFFNLVAGRWQVTRSEGDAEPVAIFHHPEHAYNVPAMVEIAQAARRSYSEWFAPYPWPVLKISEFPAVAGYAQGFAGNVPFSENLGFLTRPDPESKADAVFLVTAHEIAHQWWGNLLTPGDAPGSAVLSEGLAHFSTLLLAHHEQGADARRRLALGIEESYLDRRRPDGERPLTEVDMSRPGDRALVYDRAGLVFWMLRDLIGEQRLNAGLAQFIADWEQGPDHAALPDLLAALRERAPDRRRYDRFVAEFVEGTALPEYRLHDVTVEALPGGRYRIRGTVENRGTGSWNVPLAAETGERDEEGYRQARATVPLAAGESRPFVLETDFQPERVVVDPEARVIQLRRERAIEKL